MHRDNRHVYIGNGLWNRLVEYAKEHRVSVSAALRQLISNGIGYDDPIRPYAPDGMHSRLANEIRLVDRILAGKPR